MRFTRDDSGHQRLATLDIETTHYKPEHGELVSIGVGVYERGTPGTEARYDTFHRNGEGEPNLVERAVDQLNSYDAEAMVSFNGLGFDLEFIGDRLDYHGRTVEPPDIAIDSERHIDLFADRKHLAEQENRSWPSLEECLEAYDLPKPVTWWNGGIVDNTRFGDELGPAYLEAVETDPNRQSTLSEVIDHYLKTDLEANLALFHADIDSSFEPNLIDTEARFDDYPA